jgi:MFS family permease
MITALDVFCHSDSFSGEFTRMLFLGRTVGTILFAYISDTYGRHVGFSFGLVLSLVCNIGYFVFPFEKVYYILAFLSIMVFSLYSLITVISVEVMSIDLYSTLNGLCGSCFAFCGLTGLMIMYFFNNWFILVAFHIIVDAAIVYLNYTYLTETPKFYLTKKEYTKLNQVLEHIANMNGTHDKVKTRLDIIQTMIRTKSITDDSVKSNCFFGYLNPIKIIHSIFAPYMMILRSEKDLGNFIKLVFPYITMVFNYYGALMFIEKIPGDVKFNSLLIFLAELISPNLAGQLLTKYSRKRILIFFYIVIIANALIFINSNNEILLSILIFVNCFCICINFVATYVITAETFDSNVKTSALSVLLLIANIPMVFSELLMSIFPSPFHWFAIMSFISIFIISTMSEKSNIKNVKVAH